MKNVIVLLIVILSLSLVGCNKIVVSNEEVTYPEHMVDDEGHSMYDLPDEEETEIATEAETEIETEEETEEKTEKETEPETEAETEFVPQGLSADHPLEGPYTVIRVVDGDTLMVDIDGEETRVRFIGVNTPESVHEDDSKNTYEGEVASDYMKDRIYDTHYTVFLEYDEDREDQYGRTLAYVYDEHGESINAELLRIGYAETMFYSPNYRYQELFMEIEQEAAMIGTGFWGTGFFPTN